MWPKLAIMPIWQEWLISQEPVNGVTLIDSSFKYLWNWESGVFELLVGGRQSTSSREEMVLLVAKIDLTVK